MSKKEVYIEKLEAQLRE